ncbi:response regulator [Ancylobacter vacuolatus]|uniref:CheY-like chemotaxis protein n=1 Tax=Ancylobacter vacuolatus TaxID=223389 RepID=A0ABU0DKJ9_9HYPH|nr:response regulator [Ancylobacter vacuolatus]MDQ0348961.1 CheY-like chemotaxis protein [Ancylobacter vacuolatus]
MNTAQTMLICDDEEELAHELGEYFTSLGWRVELSVTAENAIGHLRQGLAPRVLITDLRIGAVDGRQVVAEARALPEALRPALIIIITGHVMHNVAAADFDSDFLYVKPVDPNDILDDIAAGLAGGTTAGG